MAGKGILYTPDGRLRCQGVTWNPTKRRFEFELWVPRDILPLVLAAGRRKKSRTVFPQKLSEDEAHVEAARLYTEKQAEWNDLRNAAQPDHLAAKLMPTVKPKTCAEAFREYFTAMWRVDTEGMAPGAYWSRDHATAPRMVPPQSRDAVQAIISQWFEKHDGHLVSLDALFAELRDKLHEPVESFDGVRQQVMEAASKIPMQQGKGTDGKRFFHYEDAMPIWKLWRKQRGKDTSPELEADWLRKLKLLMDFLGHENMNAVERRDIKRYVSEKLLGKGSKLGKAGYKDHAITLLALFARAHEDDDGIDQNPTPGLLAYERNTGHTDPFRPDQLRLIMREAWAHPDPVVKLTMLVMCMTGVRPHEWIGCSPKDFIWVDGELVMYIQADDRAEGEDHTKTWDSRRFMVIHHDIRDLVWAHVQSRVGKETIFDLPRYDGDMSKAATNRIGLWLRKMKGLDLGKYQRAYSARHNMTTLLGRMVNNKEIDPALAEWMTGHVSSVRGKKYMHWEPKDVAPIIARVPNPLASSPTQGGEPLAGDVEIAKAA